MFSCKIQYMAKKYDSAYIEDQTQIDAIEEFTTKIREILREYWAKRQLSLIAKQLKKIEWSGLHSCRWEMN